MTSHGDAVGWAEMQEEGEHRKEGVVAYIATCACVYTTEESMHWLAVRQSDAAAASRQFHLRAPVGF